MVLPARLRSGAAWTDACILNVSSRGMLIHTSRAIPQGSVVELRRGIYVIEARVMWRKGARTGLRAEDRVPVDDILLLGQSPALQLTAADPRFVERRTRPRPDRRDSRLRGRAFEFASVALIAAVLAAGAPAMVEQAMAKPIAAVRAALTH